MRVPGGVTAPLGNRLSRFNPLQPRVLLTHLVFLVLTGIAYESFQTANLLILFTVAIPMSTLAYFSVFIPLQFLASKVPSGVRRAFLTVLFTTAAYLTHSVALTYFVEPTNFLDLAVRRLPGDVTAAITFYWMMVGIVATGIDDLAVATDLVAHSRRELEIQRSRRLKSAKEFDRQLRTKIEASLLGELRSIAAVLQSAPGSFGSAAIAKKIHELVESKVRPLSKELVNSAEKLEIPTTRLILPRRRKLLPEAMPSRDTRAWILFFIAIPNFFSTALQNSGWLPAIALTLATIVIPVFNHLIGKLQQQRTIPLPVFWLQITLQTIIGFIPTWLLLSYFVADHPELQVLSLTGPALLIIINLMGSSWGAYFFAQKEQIDLNNQLNEEIAHELDMMNQALWLVRRRWVYIVHGTVQSSLNVAAARLVADSSARGVKHAIESLMSALESITSTEQHSVNATKMLDEIAATWEGVCEFHYRLTPSVVELLNTSDSSAACLIEIAKELVSNANRHGQATKVWLNVYPNSQGDLEIVAGNNGRPIPPDSQPGLGVKLFLELTRDFDFEQMKLGGFHATIAMPR